MKIGRVEEILFLTALPYSENVKQTEKIRYNRNTVNKGGIP